MVASGKGNPRAAWPEYFRSADGTEPFPSAGADMSGFRWEKPTPESAARDLDIMMRGARVSLRDTMEPPSAPPVAMAPPPREPAVALRPGQQPRPQDASELEWG